MMIVVVLWSWWCKVMAQLCDASRDSSATFHFWDFGHFGLFQFAAFLFLPRFLLIISQSLPPIGVLSLDNLGQNQRLQNGTDLAWALEKGWLPWSFGISASQLVSCCLHMSYMSSRNNSEKERRPVPHERALLEWLSPSSGSPSAEPLFLHSPSGTCPGTFGIHISNCWRVTCWSVISVMWESYFDHSVQSETSQARGHSTEQLLLLRKNHWNAKTIHNWDLFVMTT